MNLFQEQKRKMQTKILSGFERIKFEQKSMSTKFISSQTKLILSRILIFLSKEILLELEQNNFFSTDIDF